MGIWTAVDWIVMKCKPRTLLHGILSHPDSYTCFPGPLGLFTLQSSLTLLSYFTCPVTIVRYFDFSISLRCFFPFHSCFQHPTSNPGYCDYFLKNSSIFWQSLSLPKLYSELSSQLGLDFCAS